MPTVIGAIALLNVIFTLSVRFHSSSRIRSICEIPCFSGTNMCFKVFSPKFRSIPLAIPLLIFSLLGLLAVFVKKFGDLVFTGNNNSTPGIVKSRAYMCFAILMVGPIRNCGP